MPQANVQLAGRPGPLDGSKHLPPSPLPPPLQIQGKVYCNACGLRLKRALGQQ